MVFLFESLTNPLNLKCNTITQIKRVTIKSAKMISIIAFCPKFKFMIKIRNW